MDADLRALERRAHGAPDDLAASIALESAQRRAGVPLDSPARPHARELLASALDELALKRATYLLELPVFWVHERIIGWPTPSRVVALSELASSSLRTRRPTVTRVILAYLREIPGLLEPNEGDMFPHSLGQATVATVRRFTLVADGEPRLLVSLVWDTTTHAGRFLGFLAAHKAPIEWRASLMRVGVSPSTARAPIEYETGIAEISAVPFPRIHDIVMADGGRLGALGEAMQENESLALEFTNMVRLADMAREAGLAPTLVPGASRATRTVEPNVDVFRESFSHRFLSHPFPEGSVVCVHGRATGRALCPFCADQRTHAADNTREMLPVPLCRIHRVGLLPNGRCLNRGCETNRDLNASPRAQRNRRRR